MKQILTLIFIVITTITLCSCKSGTGDRNQIYSAPSTMVYPHSGM